MFFKEMWSITVKQGAPQSRAPEAPSGLRSWQEGMIALVMLSSI